jgi:hypothetical protein
VIGWVDVHGDLRDATTLRDHGIGDRVGNRVAGRDR